MRLRDRRHEDRILPALEAARGLANPAARPEGAEATGAGARPMTRRDFLRAAGVLAASATLAACGVTPRSEPRGGNPVQLVYQDWRAKGFPPMAQQMLEHFQESHPSIHVFFAQEPENLAARMLSDFQNGTAPDVLSGCCDLLPVWAQEQYLLDLRPYVQADLDSATLAEWDGAQLRGFSTPEGALFALPKYEGTLALFYNKDVFDQYGVGYPAGTWTYEDYQQAMRNLARPLDQRGRIDLWGSMVDISWERLQVHVNAWGGHFVDPKDPTRSMMAEPEALQAVQWLRDRMWEDHTMASLLDVQGQSARQAFIEKRLAMVEDDSSALKAILEEADFQVGVASLPAGPARKVTLSSSGGFAIYAGTRHPEAAWELLKFLISPEYGEAMAQALLLPPARASLVSRWSDLVREQYPEKSRGMNLEVFAEGRAEGTTVATEIFANMAEARRLAQAAWLQVLTLGHAQVDSIKTVSAQIEAAQRGRV